MSAGIYLDNNATTMVDPEVVTEMLPFFTEQFGNPSSLHQFGDKVGRALKKARKQVRCGSARGILRGRRAYATTVFIG